MYWQLAALNKRFESTVYLCLFFILLACVWTAVGDISQVIRITEEHWIVQYHRILHKINNESMLAFYLLFIGIAAWAKIKHHQPLYYISTGYVIAQLLGSALMVRILKIITGHARPVTIMHSTSAQTDVWIGYSTNFDYNSFPSGHTSDFFVSAIFLSLLLPKIWMRVLVFSFAAFNGFLRVAQAQHFPLDVLGGLLLAALSAFFVWKYWIFPRIALYEQAAHSKTNSAHSQQDLNID